MMPTVSEKLLQVAQNNPKVHHSGQLNIVKNAECLKNNKSGSAILIDDISPVTHDMGVRVKSKNLLNYEDFEPTYTKNGISFTNNGDGTVTVSGTATANTFYYLADSIEFLGYYILSGCPSGGSTTTYLMGFGGSNFADIGSGTIRNFPNKQKANIFIKILEGVTVENLVFKPQIELGTTATAYTPYVLDLTAVKVSRCGKNILEYPYVETTLTRNGITFTDNGDGTITVNGTATADTQFRLQDTVVYPDNYNPFKYLIGKVVGINGSPGGSSKDTYAIQSIHTGNYGNTGFAIPNSKYYRFAIFIKSGITVSNLVFKPMINLRGVTNRDYEFYNRADYTPNSDGTVNGVTSLYPNTTLMTDTEGVIIDCDYYKDIDKTFNELTTSVALSGGDS